MSDTPETDAELNLYLRHGEAHQVSVPWIEFARKLERERDESREETVQLLESSNRLISLLREQLTEADCQKRIGGLKMNNEQINIAIAELVNGDSEGPFPNYCNDLNAIHEAEKGLNDEQWVAYGKELSRLGVFPMVHATAHQRAEAFLRTLEKWEE